MSKNQFSSNFSSPNMDSFTNVVMADPAQQLNLNDRTGVYQQNNVPLNQPRHPNMMAAMTPGSVPSHPGTPAPQSSQIISQNMQQVRPKSFPIHRQQQQNIPNQQHVMQMNPQQQQQQQQQQIQYQIQPQFQLQQQYQPQEQQYQPQEQQYQQHDQVPQQYIQPQFQSNDQIQHPQQYPQWTQVQDNSNTQMTTAAASAIMGQQGMSQQHMATLQQLQSTYGSIQNNITKQLDNQKKNEIQHHGSVVSSRSSQGNLNFQNITMSQIHNNYTNHHELDQSLQNLDTIAGSKSKLQPQLQSQLQSAQKLNQVIHTNSPNINNTTRYVDPELHKKQQIKVNSSSLSNQNSHSSSPAALLSRRLSLKGQTFSPYNSEDTTPLTPNHDTYIPNQTSRQPKFCSDRDDKKSNIEVFMTEEIKKNIANISIIRLFEFTERLSAKVVNSPDLEYLKQTVDDFFCESALASLAFKVGEENRYYNFAYSLIPLIICELMNSLDSIEIFQSLIKANVLQNGSTFLDCSRLTLRSLYSDGSFCTLHGSIKVRFNRELKIERYDICISGSSSGLQFEALEKYLKENLLKPEPKGIKEEFAAFSELNTLGLRDSILRIMQIGDVMTLIKPLMHFHASSTSQSPITSLESFNRNISQDLKILNQNSGHKMPSVDVLTPTLPSSSSVAQVVSKKHQKKIKLQPPPPAKRSKDVKTGGNKRPKASDTKKTNSANKKKLSNDDISPKTIDAEK